MELSKSPTRFEVHIIHDNLPQQLVRRKITLNEPLLKLGFSFTAWIHCNTCNRCALPDHSCLGPKDGCFICGALDHKRSNCPNIGTSWRANKLVEFFGFLEKRLLMSSFLGAIYKSTKLSEDSEFFRVLNRSSHHYV